MNTKGLPLGFAMPFPLVPLRACFVSRHLFLPCTLILWWQTFVGYLDPARLHASPMLLLNCKKPLPEMYPLFSEPHKKRVCRNWPRLISSPSMRCNYLVPNSPIPSSGQRITAVPRSKLGGRRALTRKRAAPARAAVLLEAKFASHNPSTTPMRVLLLDELDHLVDAKQDVIYSFAEWCSRPTSRLVLCDGCSIN